MENLQQENHELQEANQRLRDEINCLNGEQGKPKIPANRPAPAVPNDYSSERERHTPRAWAKAKKTATIRIDREQVLPVDPAVLPPDAEFKGYEDVVVQDIVVHTDNVCFHKEKYYSPAVGARRDAGAARRCAVGAAGSMMSSHLRRVPVTVTCVISAWPEA